MSIAANGGGLPAGIISGELVIDGVPYRVLSHPLAPEREVPAPGPCDALTLAERDIATRLMAGASHAAIAQARDTSRRTVGKQVEVLYRKLGVRSRSELAARFQEG